MKKALLILILLSSCSNSDNLSKVNSSLITENVFDLSIKQYKEMLKYYNDNNDYPKIDK
tara:strand:+ start:803 stop:979 length:177 start_codon:yes stop_codon:yes gene_type:complete